MVDYGKRYQSVAMKHGMIVMWWRPIAEIPHGWGICDGTQGLPDMRGLFVKGCATGIDPGGTGGAINHNHTFVGDGHEHGIPVGVDIQSGTGYSSTTESADSSGTTVPADGQPPFYEMVFIGKL